MTDWKKYPDEKPESGQFIVIRSMVDEYFLCFMVHGVDWSRVTHWYPLPDPIEIIEEPTDITQVERGKFYKEIHISENVTVADSFDWDGFYEKLKTYLDGRNNG